MRKNQSIIHHTPEAHLVARRIALAVLVWCVVAPPVSAGQDPVPDFGLPTAYGGPAPPNLPQTIARDDEGRMTIRAVRATTPIRIDGRLEEAIYTSVQSISDFIQMEPSGGDA